MKKTKTPKPKDHFIREVNVSYRTTKSEKVKITGATDVAKFVRTVLVDNSREHCIALFLDASHQIASYSIVSIGTANSAPLAPREVFQRAVLVGAISIILAHNHPSGEVTPSQADLQVTRQMKEAGELMGIPILDHVIVSETSCVSLREDTSIW